MKDSLSNRIVANSTDGPEPAEGCQRVNNKQVNKHIKSATIAGVVAGVLNIIAGLCLGNWFFAIDATIFFVFAYGTFKKSRFCAAGAFAWAIASITFKVVVTAYSVYASSIPEMLGIVLYAVIAIYLYGGVWGTIVYRYQDDIRQGEKMKPKDEQKE